MYTTPTSRHRRAPSPPLSAAGSSQFTTTPQPKINAVTRLAIEGRAKHADDGATIRMYLKLSIPMDSVHPGSTLPLFPEENLKLLSAQVHPIDVHSAPYNFSPSSFPLLNNAARALHLPSVSQKSYHTVFGLPAPPSSTMHSSRTSSTASAVPHNAPPLDEKYTGHIIVSGYNISYILPKEFPPRFVDSDSASSRVSAFSAARMRRPSVGERNSMHFMAAIELWIPYASRPPKAPFLIAIPVPRCLSNNIKLRIYPPTAASTSSSMASLSSFDEDPGAWELASDPHVTRGPSRSASSADMADDESSDSSTYADGPSGGILVQGTFPSTERLRVRWAQPPKNIANSDSRRRIGANEAKGEMTTSVLGNAQDPSGHEGILMRLEYKGTCKGIWFPGVATMLGMDIGLEVKGADVVWPPGEDTKWTVTGGTGYTGFDVGLPSTPVSRQPSLEFSTGTDSMVYPSPITTRQSSSSSTSSLLRAPLPNDHLPEYSFEGSPSPTSLTPSVTLSSVSSLLPASEGRSRASSNAIISCRPPAAPITIHINMNDISPPPRNVFAFSITGTVLILPRRRPRIPNNGHVSDDDSDVNPIVLPRFCVLAADSETVSTIIRNESEGSTVEVYYISGDLRDAQTRKTVLQRNAINRCGNDGARITLRPIARAAILQRGVDQVADNSRLLPWHSPLDGNKAALSPMPLGPISGGMRRRRDGPLMISSVDAIVTPLHLRGKSLPDAHAVRVDIHAPPDTDSEWLEFGLTQATSSPPEGEERQYQVDIVSVSVDGVPVRFESSTFAERDKKSLIDLVPSYDEKPRNQWITWVRVHVGDQGGLVRVDYVVSDFGKSKDLKKIANAMTNLDILIPTFALRVGRLEVMVETCLEMTFESNFAHQRRSPDGHKLLHYSLDQFFIPTLSLTVERSSSRTRMGWLSLGRLFVLLLQIFLAIVVPFILINLGIKFEHMRQSLDRLAVRDIDHHEIPPLIETIFITTTVSSSPPTTETNADSVNSQATTPSFTSAVSIITAGFTDSTPSTPSLHTRERPQIDTTTLSSIPTPSPSSGLGENSLLPIPALPFDWSKIRIDFPPAAQKTVDKVLEGLGVVWQMFRKVYHYPLDPP